MAMLAALLPSAPVVGQGANEGLDAEGYIRPWLVLAPIPLKEGQDGTAALDEEQIRDEANLKPKPGDKIDVRGKELAWKECATQDQVLDLNHVLGKRTENSVGYAVVYLVADADLTELTLKLGSDDQVKVYLNGKLIHSIDEGREFEKDEDSVSDLTLKAGLNVLVLKVINEEEDWSASTRFLDKDGKPVSSLKATTQPG
jgi:hypothetical protein